MSKRLQKSQNTNDKPKKGKKKTLPEKIELVMNKHGKYEIPFQYLQHLTVRMPRGFDQLLTNLNVVFTSAGATEVGLSDQRQNLRPTSDLELLYAVRGIITGASKLIDRAHFPDSAKELLYRSGVDPKTLIGGANFTAEMTQHVQRWGNLKSSLEAIQNNKIDTAESKAAAIVLRRAVTLLEEVIIEQVKQTATNVREKTDIKLLLVQKGTISYLWNRMVVNRLAHQNNLGLEIVLFPTKVENGLALTVREARSNKVVANLELSNRNDAILKFMRLNSYSDYANLKKDDEKDQSRVLDFPWVMIPELVRSVVIRSRKFSTSLVKGDNAVPHLVNEIFICAYMLMAPLGINLEHFIPLTIQVKIEPTSPISLIEQALKALENDPENDNFSQLSEGKYIEHYCNVVGIAKTLSEAMVQSTAIEVKGEKISSFTDPQLKMRALFREINTHDTDYIAWANDRPILAELRKKDHDRKDIITGTLAPRTKEFIKSVKEDKDHPLYGLRDRIALYLKQFNNLSYQDVAVAALLGAAEQMESNLEEGTQYSDEEISE